MMHVVNVSFCGFEIFDKKKRKSEKMQATTIYLAHAHLTISKKGKKE